MHSFMELTADIPSEEIQRIRFEVLHFEFHVHSIFTMQNTLTPVHVAVIHDQPGILEEMIRLGFPSNLKDVVIQSSSSSHFAFLFP